MLCPNSPKQNLNWFPAKPLALAPQLPPILGSTYIHISCTISHSKKWLSYLFILGNLCIFVTFLTGWLHLYKSEIFWQQKQGEQSWAPSGLVPALGAAACMGACVVATSAAVAVVADRPGGVASGRLLVLLLLYHWSGFSFVPDMKRSIWPNLSSF